MRRLLFLLLVGVMAAPVAAAQFPPTDGPKNPFKELEEPKDFLFYGKASAGHYALGWAPTGENVRVTEMCLGGIVNRDTKVGLVSAAGYLNENTEFGVYFETFWSSEPAKRDGVRFDVPVFGTTGLGGLRIPATKAAMAAWGNGTMSVGGEYLYHDPVNYRPTSRVDDEPQVFENWTAEFYLLNDGHRDNVSKGILTKDRGGFFDPANPNDVFIERGQKEALLIFRNHTAMEEPYVEHVRFGTPRVLDLVEEPHVEAVDAVHEFNHTAWGGDARFRVRLVATGPSLALAQLDVSFWSPSGEQLAKTSVGGVPTGTDERTVEFPLDEVEWYTIQVRGNATGARYEILGDLLSPSEVQVTFWWEEVYVGWGASRSANDCKARLFRDTAAAPLLISHFVPPKLRLDLVILGVGASLLTLLYVAKLVFDNVSTTAFTSKFRHR